MKILAFIGAIFAIGLVVGLQSLYTVDETEYVVIRRFGEIQKVTTAPGLAFKAPFVDNVVVFDNRLLRIDMPPSSMPDKESQFLDIDAYVRYKITDPKAFLLSLSDDTNAAATIGQIVVSELRSAVGVRDRKDIIGGEPITHDDGTVSVIPRLRDDGVPTRDAMMQDILSKANAIVSSDANSYGVDIVDVRIKRADFPNTTEANVFSRMRSERKVRADKLRAEGEEAYLTITADVDKEVRIILAEANKTANELKGEGEAKAIATLADALERDPEFFAFRRSLEAYVNIFDEYSTVVLSSDSDLFKYLQNPN
jgi:membrane protease subunit HflC